VPWFTKISRKRKHNKKDICHILCQNVLHHTPTKSKKLYVGVRKKLTTAKIHSLRTQFVKTQIGKTGADSMFVEHRLLQLHTVISSRDKAVQLNRVTK